MAERSSTEHLAQTLLMLGVTLARIEASDQLWAEQRLQGLWGDIQQAVRQSDFLTAPTLAGQLRQVRPLTRELDDAISTVYADLATQHQTTRRQVTAWYLGALLPALSAVFGRVRTLPDQALTSVSTQGLVMGARASEWWARLAATVQQRMADTLRQGVLQEATAQTILANLRAQMASAASAVDGLIQTSLASVTQQTMQAVVDANQTKIGGLGWLTTLDNRACPICIALSGQSWTLDRKPLGKSGPWPGPPPIHKNCRCVLLPLGDGESMPASQTFDAWLQEQPADEQRTILGPGRYQLWQAGRLRLSRLVDQRHRPLTLEQLRRESAA